MFPGRIFSFKGRVGSFCPVHDHVVTIPQSVRHATRGARPPSCAAARRRVRQGRRAGRRGAGGGGTYRADGPEVRRTIARRAWLRARAARHHQPRLAAAPPQGLSMCPPEAVDIRPRNCRSLCKGAAALPSAAEQEQQRHY